MRLAVVAIHPSYVRAPIPSADPSICPSIFRYGRSGEAECLYCSWSAAANAAALVTVAALALPAFALYVRRAVLRPAACAAPALCHAACAAPAPVPRRPAFALKWVRVRMRGLHVATPRYKPVHASLHTLALTRTRTSMHSVQVKNSVATVETARQDVPSLLVKSGLSHMSFLSLLTLFPIQWPKVLRSRVGARGGGRGY